MARGSARSRWPLWLVAVVLVAALAYALSPVRIVVEGVGTVQPAFEDLVVVMPDVSGMVTRVRVSPGQDVEQGTPLFEYIPDGQYAVQTHFTPTRPGTSRDAPTPLPEWYRAGQERRLTRDTALRHWTTRVYSSRQQPLMWERLLQQRLSVRIVREDELAMADASAAENARLGRHESNLVHVFDRGIGMYRATEDGQPFTSNVAGMVYSLWVRQRLQFGPAPVAEVMRPGTAIEVFGLVPPPPDAVRELPGWSARVVPGGVREVPAASLVVRTIEFGRIPMDAQDAGLIFEGLPVLRASVFVRLRLAEAPPREILGTPVLFTLMSPARPRLWFWLKAREPSR